MKNSILNLGKALNKAEQMQVLGGYPAIPDDQKCQSNGNVCWSNGDGTGQPYLCCS